MSDQQPDETQTDKQPWPPAPEGSNAGAPIEPSQPRVNTKEIATGAIMGIIVAGGMTLIAAIPCLLLSFFVSKPVAGTVFLVVPVVTEFFIAYAVRGKHKTMGWPLGIVSMSVSVLLGIALILINIAGTPAPGGE